MQQVDKGLFQADEFVITNRLPTSEEYHALHNSVGIHNDTFEADRKNTLFSVCVTHKSQLIGCGRIIGNDSLIYKDIFVLREYKKEFVNFCIMERLLQFLDDLQDHQVAPDNGINRLAHGMFLMWAKNNLI